MFDIQLIKLSNVALARCPLAIPLSFAKQTANSNK